MGGISAARRAAIITAALERPATSLFTRQDNRSIDWAPWSWGPVTGCLHNCAYCYARDIAKRFYTDISDVPEERFAPVFRPHRLTAPARTPLPLSAAHGAHNVFVGSMTDLFGKWVPQDWIDAVFARSGHPQWNSFS